MLRLSKEAVFGDAASAPLLIKWENWYSAPAAVWPPADPSHFGLNGPQSYPLIGNISVIQEDFGRNAALFGYILRDPCDPPSDFRSEGGWNLRVA